MPADSTGNEIDVLVNDTDIDGGLMQVASRTNGSHGTVTIINGGAKVTYTPDAGYCNSSGSPDTFTYTLNGGSFATVSVTVTCAAPNIPPDVDNSSGALAYTENDPPTAIDTSIAITDTDSLNLTGATVQITGNYVPGEDVLALPAQPTVTASFDAPTGRLTLSGTATVAAYEAALEAVTYANTSEAPSTSTRTVTYQARDAGGFGVADTHAIMISATDDPPTAVDNTATVVEDSGASVIDVLANETDVDGGAKLISAVTDPDHGTVVITPSAPGSGLTYQPDPDYCNQPPGGSPDTFDYTLTPGGDVATVSVTVTCSNDAPVIATTAGSLAYTENAGPVVVDGGVTLSDVDSAFLSSATVTIQAPNFNAAQDTLALPPNAQFTTTFSGGVLTLTAVGSVSPSAFQAALRTVTYANSSDAPSPAARTIAFQATDDAAAASNVATRTINIGAVNDAPVVTTSGGSASFTLGGSAAVVDGALSVTDLDSAQLSGATVSISANLTAGDALSFTPAGSITGVGAGTGTLTLSGAGTPAEYQSVLRSVTYAGTTGTPATRTIAFQVTDTAAANSNIATRGVTIGAAPNGAPVVTTTAGSTAYTENAAPVTIDGGLTVVDSTDTNLESLQVRISAGFEVGDVLTFTPGSLTGSYAPATGILTLSGSATVATYQTVLRSVQFSSTHDNPAVSKTIEFKVNDGDVDSNLATKVIAVTRVNDAPVVTTTGGATAYTENAAAVTVDGGLTVVDPDDTNLESLRVRISAGLDTGDVLTFSPGSLTGSYVPGTGILTLSGTASVATYQTVLRSVQFSSTHENPAVSKTIEFKVNDGDVDSDLATKAIAVTRVNDAPVVTTTATSLAYTENAGPVVVDGGVTLTDVDSAFLSSATVTIQAPNFNAGQDTLALAPDAQFTTTFSGGVLTITAVGSISAAPSKPRCAR